MAFAETLVALAQSDPRIVAVCNDSVGSSNLKAFKTQFPDRLINVGIAEQNLVGVSAGLASAGKIPFTCGASCFLTGRALEQIKVDLAYSRHNVKLCGISSGMAYGELGPTHHSIEDLAWTRAIAGLTVIVPADPRETAQAVRAAAAFEGPVFLRLSRMAVPAVHADDFAFEIGRATELRSGTDVTLVAAGVTVCRALDAARLLEVDGISAAVLNVSTVRPIDRDCITAAARRGPIVTVEEHTVVGGLGSAVAEVVVETHPTRMRLLGVPGVFAPTGSPSFLLDHFGLSAEGISDAGTRAGARIASWRGASFLRSTRGRPTPRSLAVDENGVVVARASRPVEISFPRPGWVEQDGDAVWRTVAEAMDDCLTRVPAASVAAIGVTNQRESVLVWDRATGRPLGPCIVWQCRRSAPFCATLRDRGLGPLLEEKTGLTIDPLFSASKIRWLLDAIPDGHRRAAAGELCAGTMDSWVLWNLTGGRVHACDATNASRTQLFNLASGTWDEALLEVFGVPRAMLPAIRSSSGIVGETVARGNVPTRHCRLPASLGIRTPRCSVTLRSRPARSRRPTALARR